MLLGLALLPTLKTAVERVKGGGAATPIELVDVGAIAPDTVPDPTTVPSASTATVPAPPQPAATAPVSLGPPPAAVPSTSTAIPPTVFAPAPAPVATPPTPTPTPTPIASPVFPSPAPISTPVAPPASPVQPSPFIPPEPPPVAARSPLPPPQPFPENPPADRPAQPSDPTGDTGNPASPNDGSNDGSDVAVNPAPDRGAPGVDNPASGPDAGSGDDLGEVVIGRQPTPTNLTLSVVNVRYLSLQETVGAIDTPEENAELLTNSISVVADPTQPGSCPVFPDSVPDFGAPITLRLTVEADGRVSRAEPQQPAPVNYAYTDLVQCLAQNGLQFRPARDSGIERPSDNAIVEVTVVGE